jgi:hypothetical protein
MPAIISIPLWRTAAIQHHISPLHRDGTLADAAIRGSVHHSGQAHGEEAAATATSLDPLRGILWGFLFSLCAWSLLLGLVLFIFG